MDNPETAIEQPITLFAKMARVMGEMKRIPKHGRNAHFGYPYAEESDIADIVREELAKEKIAFFPSIIRSEQVPFERVTKDGKKTTGISTHLWFQMTFACGDTGATFSCLWESESEDSQDKGINKAATAGVKYFLLKTFIISTGEKKDDPDSGLGKVAGRIDPARRQNEQRKVSGAPNPPPPQSKTPAQAEKRDAGAAEAPAVEVIEANTASSKAWGTTIETFKQWFFALGLSGVKQQVVFTAWREARLIIPGKNFSLDNLEPSRIDEAGEIVLRHTEQPELIPA